METELNYPETLMICIINVPWHYNEWPIFFLRFEPCFRYFSEWSDVLIFRRATDDRAANCFLSVLFFFFQKEDFWISKYKS